MYLDSVVLPSAQVARYAYKDNGPHTFEEDVRDTLGIEPKRASSLFRGSISPVVPLSQLLTNIPLGTDTGTRVGNWLKPLSIDGHFVVTGTQNEPVQFSQVRVSIIQYHADESAAPFDPQSILQDNDWPMGPYNYDEKEAFTVIWDRYCSVSHQLESTHFMHTFHISVDLSECPQPTYDVFTEKREQFFMVANTASVVPNALAGVFFNVNFLYSDS